VKELGESGDRYVSPYNIARVYGAINDTQRALEWLERAYREHNPDLIELTREPSFAGLHSDAKFRELVERIGWRPDGLFHMTDRDSCVVASIDVTPMLDSGLD
jgi:hypothetical protein